jgi:hypothetical protein
MKNETLLTTEQAVRAGNDGQNQDIKGRFVGQHVYCNVNSLVEYCLSKGFEDPDSPVNFDAIENYYSYPEYSGEHANFEGGSDDDRDAEIERLRDLQSDLYDKIEEETDQSVIDTIEAQRDKIEEEITELNNLETEPAEIFEWWAVSSFLFDKLREQGCTVVDAGSCYVWGRQTTGQAILLDGVITRICADMGILEGQENSWANVRA